MMYSKVLVTGAAGFLATHLCNQLAASCEVYGVDISPNPGINGIDWKTIEDGSEIPEIAKSWLPDIVVHAAFINRPAPELAESDYLNEMINFNLRLMRSVDSIGAKFVLTSSSAVYGQASDGGVIDESTPVVPVTGYGLAKLLQENLARYTLGENLTILRLFNLCGPGQKLGMLLPDWVDKVKRYANNSQTPIEVRHMRTSRDYVDVRDASRAIISAMSGEFSGQTYNVASGISVSLREIAAELERLSETMLKIVEKDTCISLQDVAGQVGANQKILESLNWKPVISWKSSLGDLWRAYSG
ncbi:NAD(P)-dependent oxidoreductase [Mariniblastus sp.]|nr:NAD(P)-dependent oxidoreductase [Mariniblastus sp.]MDC0293923.1 NAD(P)-dependent oxidoreductase [Mariniblastus sp.]MDC3223920.1 NAD(P)-dependent oxidoreductase [Mariniblastus sp.]